ncbi:MAG: peptide chain release factor N(5)-glutamine methyltransferase [Fibrobacter sp.]|jgi:release factor glutamine methyltransferase|nr:peptide chain release factor N(5)-glutamine methyltransferase [Fibrobacter sp.]
MKTVLDILNTTTDFFKKKEVPDPRLDAQYLLAFGLKMKRMDLYLNFDRPLSEPELELLRPLVARRAKREPLQHIIGTTSFRGHEIKCDSRALIPRAETEMLIDLVRGKTETQEALLLADIGTGTGAIAIALAKELKFPKVFAADISSEALLLAKENVAANALEDQVQLFQGNLLEALPAGEKLHGLVSNLPYIPEGERENLQAEVRLFDPALALFSGEDGLDLIRELLHQTENRLLPGAFVLLEIGSGQEKLLEAECANYPWLRFEGSHSDFYGNVRFVEYSVNV